MAERSAVEAWELHAVRNKGGVYTCHMTNPHGVCTVEPLDVTVCAVARRQWANPPEEIEQIGALACALRTLPRHIEPIACSVGRF